MRNTLKLSLLTILAIPLFIMNVSAKEIVNDDGTYQRGTFQNKTYEFSETFEDFQELKIEETVVPEGVVSIVDEDTLSIDWNYLENVHELYQGEHNLSFTFATETVETTLNILADPDSVATVNNIFASISTEFETAAVETDALNYDGETGMNPIKEELRQAIVDRLAEAGFHLEDYGYNAWIYWNFYETGNASDYRYEVYKDGDIIYIPIHLTYSNSHLRNEADRIAVQSIIDNNSFIFVRYVPLTEVLEAYKNENIANLYSSINERMMALIEGTNIEFIHDESEFGDITSYVVFSQYYFVINGILYGVVDPVGGYVSSIDHPGEDIDLNLYANDYIKEQLLQNELILDTDTINYSLENQEVILSRGEEKIYIGYVHLLEPCNYIEGENSTVTPEEPLSVEIDEDVDEYLYTEVDDQEVNSAYITVTSGSTVLDFSPEFTDSLSEGVHTLTAYFMFGKAETTFTIVKPVVEEVATFPTQVVNTSYTNTVYQASETKKEELKEVSEDKKDKSKDDKKDDKSDEEEDDVSKGGGGKGFIIGIIIAVLIAGIGFYLYKEGQE